MVLNEDRAEVERLTRSFEEEFRPSGEAGKILVRRMAVMAVRMDKCVAHEEILRTERTVEAQAEFDAEWPAQEGVDCPIRAKVRAEVADLVWFDHSREANLVRKYEAAAERCFLRSIKELRTIARDAKVATTAPKVAKPAAESGSFLTQDAMKAVVESLAPKAAPKPAAPAPKPAPRPTSSLDEALIGLSGGVSYVPIAIGKRA